MPSPQPSTGTFSKIWLLIAICLVSISMPLGFTGPALVLPAIRESLGGSPLALNWVTNAFMLSFGGGLMASGAVADTYGRKRVLLWGLCLILVSVLAMVWAPGILWLNLLRGLQGVGAAMALAAGTAALAQVFEGKARTRAFSLLGTSFGVGLAFGPLIAGWLLGHVGWRGVVLSVGVLVQLALVISARTMQESRNPQAAGLDLPGTLTFTAALSLFTLGILQAPASGWGSEWVLAALAGSVLLGRTFVVVERRHQHPMLDLSLFRIPRFVGVQLLAAAPAYAYVVLLILLPIRFAGLEGFDALKAGLLMMMLSAPMLVVPSFAAWLTRWFSARWICAVGLLMCVVGLLWLSQCGTGSAPLIMTRPMLLIGLGIGLPWGLMDGLAVSVVPRERAGMATGIFSTVRVAGEGVALALVSAGLTALVAWQLGGLSAGHASAAQVSQAAQYITTGGLQQALGQVPGIDAATLLQAYDAAFGMLLCVLAGITLVTAVVVLVFLREPVKASLQAQTA